MPYQLQPLHHCTATERSRARNAAANTRRIWRIGSALLSTGEIALALGFAPDRVASALLALRRRQRAARVTLDDVRRVLELSP